MVDPISRSEGRRLFGLNPAGYEDVRPDYPGWVFDRMVEHGAFGAGRATLEIGAGTGRVTRRLVDYGATPLTVIEPDPRFSRMLAAAIRGAPQSRIVQQSFEDAALPEAGFDLVVAATAFHWIDPAVGWSKLRRVLRAGGQAALLWNVFQVLDKADAFHEATLDLLSRLPVTPSGAPGTLPYALDRPARESDARAVGFDAIEYFESHWEVVLSTEQVGRLYEGFSHIQRQDAGTRTGILSALMDIADEQFGGRVVRNITTCLYLMS